MTETAPEAHEGRRDLVVIGASAGGVETLKAVVGRLPADLPAAICIVMHLAPGSPSALAHILRRSGSLPCHAARDGQELKAGEILVAPPDRHLIVSDGVVNLTVGPRENNHRPAVDALFRSAAIARGPRVIGVVLSGTRDDGTAGLAVIKAHGGVAVVQDPDEALYPGMPASAIANVNVDVVVPSSRIAQTIAAMVGGDDTPKPDPPRAEDTQSSGAGSDTTICPECGGVLTEHTDAGAIVWKCRVGHRYSPVSLVDAQSADIEAALWTSVRALEDRRKLLERLASQHEERGQPRSAWQFRRRADEAQHHADLVRRALGQAAWTTLTSVADEGDEPTGQEATA